LFVTALQESDVEDILKEMRIMGSGDPNALVGRGCNPFTSESDECPGSAQSLCCDSIYPVRTF